MCCRTRSEEQRATDLQRLRDQLAHQGQSVWSVTRPEAPPTLPTDRPAAGSHRSQAQPAAGVTTRRRAANLGVNAASRRNPVGIPGISSIRSVYAKFAALRRFVIPAPGVNYSVTNCGNAI